MVGGLDDILPVSPRRVDEGIGSAWEAIASDYPTEIGVGKAVGENRRGSGIDDIVNLFAERYEAIRKILRIQCGFRESHTIFEVSKERKSYRPYHVIGIVSSRRRTKSGGLMIEIEDKTGILSAFVRKEDSASQTLLCDDVVGLSGSFGKTLIFFGLIEFNLVIFFLNIKIGVERILTLYQLRSFQTFTWVQNTSLRIHGIR